MTNSSHPVAAPVRPADPTARPPATSAFGDSAAPAERAIRSVCVYCGSGAGNDPAFADAARALGRSLAEAGVSLVYGGGNIGLMGTVARAVLDHGGKVTGIIPGFLRDREIMLEDAQETIVVPDMHTRKKLMFDRADAFVAMPGGIGTLEELVEQLTWSQLGQHRKPILLLDTAGFWRPLVDLFDHMRETGFIRPGFAVRYIVAAEVADVLPALQAAANAPEPVDAPATAPMVADRL